MFQARLYGPSGQEYGMCHPHLTLQEMFRTRSIRSLNDELSSIASSQPEFDVKPDGIRSFNGQDLVMTIENSRPLNDLHRKVIEAVRFHRTDYHHRKYNRQKYRDSEFEDPVCYGNLKLYGMPFAGPLYSPHVTLAYGLRPEVLEQAMEMASELKIPSWRANSAVINREDEPMDYSRIHSVLIFQKDQKKSR